MSTKQVSKVGKKFIKSARNVLTIPKESFWPLLEYEAGSKFMQLLKDSLKLAKRVQPEVPWSERKKLSKAERKIKILEFFENLPSEVHAAHKKATDLRKSLCLGVNDVCRALEKDELSCCLVCGEVKPKVLISHLLDLAKIRRTPILVLNTLKENSKEALGFSCLAIGFKKEILQDPKHDMRNLCSEINTIFCANFPYETDTQPKNEELEMSVEPDLMPTYDSEKAKGSENCIETPTQSLSISDIYLYRENTDYRVFRPNAQESEIEESRVNNVLGMVTNLNENEKEYNVSAKKKPRYYEPPTVSRIQANPSKIRKFKKKKK